VLWVKEEGEKADHSPVSSAMFKNGGAVPLCPLMSQATVFKASILASYPVCAVGKAGGERADHSPVSSAMFKNSGAVPPCPHVSMV
jgi:hypothetical protein